METIWCPLSDLKQCFYTSLILILIFSLIMIIYSKGFYFKKNGSRRTFSMLDLEFPSSGRYYARIMCSIILMKLKDKEEISYYSLKNNIFFDFLFILPAYYCVYLLCGFASQIPTTPFPAFFSLLAVVQPIAALLDYIENGFILYSYKKPKLFIVTKSKGNTNNKKEIDCDLQDDDNKNNSLFLLYKSIVNLKWILVLSGLIFSLFAILYYMLIYEYSEIQSIRTFSFKVITTLIVFSFVSFVLIKYSPIQRQVKIWMKYGNQNY